MWICHCGNKMIVLPLSNCMQNVLTQSLQSSNESRKIKNDFRLDRHTGMEGQVEHNSLPYLIWRWVCTAWVDGSMLFKTPCSLFKSYLEWRSGWKCYNYEQKSLNKYLSININEGSWVVVITAHSASGQAASFEHE